MHIFPSIKYTGFKLSIIAKCLLLLTGISSIACQNETENENQNTGQAEYKEKLLQLNKKFVDKESEEIVAYITRRSWEVQTTGTGLRLHLLQKGKGKLPHINEKVYINYKMYALDGGLLYESAPGKPLEFTTGRAEVPSGLEEGVSLLNKGSKAVLILPSHLAFGLSGNNDKIKPGMALVYEIEVLN